MSIRFTAGIPVEKWNIVTWRQRGRTEMCEHCNIKIIKLHHPTPRGFTTAGVDACIAPLVQALNDGGFQTVASCCGHGKRPGNIALEDGRELLILPNYEEARKLEHETTHIYPYREDTNAR